MTRNLKEAGSKNNSKFKKMLADAGDTVSDNRGYTIHTCIVYCYFNLYYCAGPVQDHFWLI